MAATKLEVERTGGLNGRGVGLWCVSFRVRIVDYGSNLLFSVFVIAW